MAIEQNNNNKGGFKAFLTKKPVRYSITSVLIIFAVLYGIKIFNNGNGVNTETPAVTKQVKTTIVGEGNDSSQKISAAGSVKPAAKVDVVALARGTVRNIFFAVGDSVFKNKTLLALSDSATLTNLINAETNYVNLQNSFNATKRITQETIRQAEIGTQSAQDAVAAAEIGLKTAQDNLDNSLALTVKRNQDTKDNAITSFNGHLNTIFNALDQIDNILKADEDAINGGGVVLDPSLGAKSVGSVSQARGSYRLAKDRYDLLSGRDVSSETVLADTIDVSLALGLARTAVDDLIHVLDNSVANLVITDAWLAAQKANFTLVRANVAGAKTAADNTLHALQNLTITNTTEEAALENAVLAAENRLAMSNTGYQNSLVTLESVKQGSQQQILGAQTALDGAKSQLNLARIQAGDLTVGAPISGTVTAKTVELGTEVNPGQKIAEISNTKLLKIEIDISAEDINKIKLGQNVKINPGASEFTGTISRIFPTADPVSKKVRVEIVYDNSNNDLIIESFVEVEITIDNSPTDGQAIIIPLKALIIGSNEKYVFIVDGSKAVKKTVETGETIGSDIKILSGLTLGEELITDNGKNLEDQESIEVIN